MKTVTWQIKKFLWRIKNTWSWTKFAWNIRWYEYTDIYAVIKQHIKNPMKKTINEIQRMQQLAGLNEWKVQIQPLHFNIGDKVDFNDELKGTIIDIVKGYKNIPKYPDISIQRFHDNSDGNDYYYLFVLQHNLPYYGDRLWASESWLKIEP